jgi:hypothetical protein
MLWLKNSFHNDASSTGVRWAARGKDAGSPHMQAVGATEDAAARRPARPGGTRLIVKRVLKQLERFGFDDDRCVAVVAASFMQLAYLPEGRLAACDRDAFCVAGAGPA